MGVEPLSGTQGMVSSPHSHEIPLPTSIVLIGTSFRISSMEFRERVFSSLQKKNRIAVRRATPHILESSSLVTCNRMEFYVATDDPERVAESILSEMLEAAGREGEFYIKKDLDAVTHIFRVASGLDSLVVGEEQILQQVKEAATKARGSGTAGSILSSLFVAAFNAGRRVRRSYDVAPSKKSVSAFALQFALKKLGRRPREVLLIGTGETARLAATQLKGAKIYVASRRKNAPEWFRNPTVVSYKQLRRLAWEGDLVISATRHRGYVIKKGDLPDKRKLVLLDLAFPRNIDPAFKTSRFIELYDLDDLAIHVKSMPQNKAFAKSETMVREEAERFTRRLVASRLSPTLANIYMWAEGIRSSETHTAMSKLPNLSGKERKVVEVMSRSLVSKLLAPHTTFVKESTGGITQVEKLRLLENLFGPEASK